MIAALAAALAICELEAKDAQVAYLTRHIEASDAWAQYQGKSDRRVTYAAGAELLASLPNAGDAAVQQRIAAARHDAQRMKSEPGADGMDQLAAKAHGIEHERDHEAHRQRGWSWPAAGCSSRSCWPRSRS